MIRFKGYLSLHVISPLLLILSRQSEVRISSLNSKTISLTEVKFINELFTKIIFLKSKKKVKKSCIDVVQIFDYFKLDLR